MKTELKTSLPSKKSLLLLTVIAVLSGALGCIIGEIILPVTIVALALIYCLESENRVFSYVSSLVLVGINAITLLFAISSFLYSVQAIALSLIISIAFKKSYDKANSAYIMTLLCAGLTVAGYSILAMILTKDYSLDGVVAFYNDVVNAIKTPFADASVEIYGPFFNMVGIEMTPEHAVQIFDYCISMIISYLFISAFAVVGISTKLFGIFYARLSGDKNSVKDWRFEVSPVYGFAYVIVVLLTLFAKDPSSVFSVVVNNLYNIFMVIFAYVGINVIANLLSRKINKFLSALIPIGACLLAGSFAVQLLAVVGVFFTVNKNRFNLSKDGQ